MNVQRILLIKTSSMGDVVHNFPLVSDLAVRFPQAEIDWVIEDAFAALPPLHAMVKRVIPVALRRWRTSLGSRKTWREIRTFLRALRAREYDAIIDTQGLIKSALVTACGRGRKYGLNWASSREPIGWFYNRAFSIPWDRHAVERNRALAAAAFGYQVTGPANYALHIPAQIDERLRRHLPAHFVAGLKRPYAMLLHATSAPEKEWPEERWGQLGKALHAQGLASLLPFGNPDEHARAERLANAIPGALVPPPLPLDETGALLANAAVVVGVDTGLTHLGAALGRPTVGIYCVTDPRATGLYGGARSMNAGTIGRSPDLADVLSSIDRVRAD